MSKKNTPEKTRQRTLVFVAMFVGFLGTGVFAGISSFSAHQKNQDFVQLDAEEKISRLPEYLLKDRSLLNNEDSRVRYSTAKALRDLWSKDAIPDLISLLKKEFNSFHYTDTLCAVAEALGELQAKEAVPLLILAIENGAINSDCSCVVEVLGKLQAKEAIPQLTELLKDPNHSVQYSARRALNKLQNISHLIYSGSESTVTLWNGTLSRETFQFIRKQKYAEEEKILELIIALNKSSEIDQYKILNVLIDLDGLNKSQIRAWISKVVKDLEKIDVSSESDLMKKSLAIDIATKIYLKFNQEFKKSKIERLSMHQSRQIRDSQWMLAGSALTAFLFLLVLTLFALRELQIILWKDHMICYFSEEVVGELIALRRELTQAKKPRILIEITLLYVVLTLIWAFYIQINIENLWSPSKNQRRR